MVDAPLDPAGIARRQFATARKGFDQNEVRGYLGDLAAVVEDLRRREAELAQRVEQAEARAQAAEQLDEHRLVEVLGSETARVLESAREAAADIRHKAEESAARLISEANDEAHRLRAEAESQLATQRLEMLAEVETLQREAAAEVERRRVEAAEVVAEMRREAEQECEAIRAEAHEEARQLVEEAQVVRERMLRDLARRRRSAREQIERLNAARERLLAAHEVVRRTVEEATTELTVALPEAKLAGDAAMRRVADEPEPSVEDLDEMVAMARIAGLVDVGPAPTSPSTEVLPEGAAAVEAAVVGHPEEPAVEPAEADPVIDEIESVDAEPTDLVASGDEGDELVSDDPADGVEPEDWSEPEDEADAPDTDDWSDDEEDQVVEPGSEAEHESPLASDEVPGSVAGSSVDELFARLRAGAEQEPATPELVEVDTVADAVDERFDVAVSVAILDDAEVDRRGLDQVRSGPDDGLASPAVPATGPEEEHPPDEHDQAAHDVGDEAHVSADLLAQRDDLLASTEADLSRRLKLVLADEQNEVLDSLRRVKGPIGLDDLLPPLGQHAAAYTDAARDDLSMVAGLGAEAVGGAADGTGEALAAELAQWTVEPLRERMEHCIADSNGDLDEVTRRLRAVYREWKSQRIGDAVRHFTAAAYAHGAYAGVPNGTPLCWLVDRSGPPCPDADDNALAGTVRKGEPFPTGDHCPPAHLGCRCLVVPAAVAANDDADPR